MGTVKLLDCTLRDGGYINEWNFGEQGIVSIINKLENTGIEIIEVGFIKGAEYNPDRTLFPNVETINTVVKKKNDRVMYVAMIDMSSPVPVDRLIKRSSDTIDGIRVIFKKNMLNEAYDYCAKIKKLGYEVFANFVSTDAYTDKEFIEGIELFNNLKPYGVAIVDTFGMIKKKHFKRLVAIADNNLSEEIALCYHAHNNLQQAFGNAETLVEMNLKRDVIIDACVFGMGRGAGNLNLELFADYMNENYSCNYQITPMLEIMDEYLSEFYHKKFWGYSLPLYLSAIHGCHPNYAIYLAEKNTLTEKAFDGILSNISENDKFVFSKDKAENYYRQYFNSFIDDKTVINELRNIFSDKVVVLLAPGQTLRKCETDIKASISSDAIVVSVNFYNTFWNPDFVFNSNIRRYKKLVNACDSKIIATSNIPNNIEANYVINFSSYVGPNNEVYDNAGLMALRFLESVNVREVLIAGMDGYSDETFGNYMNNGFEARQISEAQIRNKKISEELEEIGRRLHFRFITPTRYKA